MEATQNEVVETKVNWRIAADRALVDERVELKSAPGQWVRVQRFSKQGEAEIRSAELKPFMKNQAIRRQIVEEAKKANNLKSDSDLTTGEMEAELKERVLSAVLSDLKTDELDQLEAQIIKLVQGVHSHNFDAPEGGPATMEWARELCKYADIFNEVSALVRAKNIPLVERT